MYFISEIHNYHINTVDSFDLAHIFSKKYNFDYITRDSSIVLHNNLDFIKINDENDMYSPILTCY